MKGRISNTTEIKYTCWMWKKWKHFEINVNKFLEFYYLNVLINYKVCWPRSCPDYQWLYHPVVHSCLAYESWALSNKRSGVVPMKKNMIFYIINNNFIVYVHNCLILVYTTVVLPGTRNSLCWCRTGVWWNAIRIHSGRGTVSIYTVLSVVAFVFGLRYPDMETEYYACCWGFLM